jgi:tetratricopeptide (TPR) repeat protein
MRTHVRRGSLSALLLLAFPLSVSAQEATGAAVDTSRADSVIALTIDIDTSRSGTPEPAPSRAFSFGMLLPPMIDDTAAMPAAIDPERARAMTAGADEHVQAQRFDEAREEYAAALDADPFDLRALVGAGYLAAWEGRHAEATASFERALSVDPQSLDAAKGLAYVALWTERADEAAARFGALAARDPDDVELASMYAQSLLAARRSSDARIAFERALTLDSTNVALRNGLEIARSARPKVELTTWAGSTWFDDDERLGADPNLGFRLVEVAIWPTTRARLWFQYDNGLSLDNVVLSAGNRTVPAGYIGGFMNYERIHTTRLELGWRSLPGSVGEILVRSEHVIALPDRYAIKAGLWLGMRDDDRSEWVAHSGLTIPIGGRFNLDPTFFYADHGMPNEHEWRLLLAGEYRFAGGARLAGGWAVGQATTGYIDDYRGISDRYLKLSLPVGRASLAHALFRTEYVGDTDATTILSIGLTVGLSER